MPTTAERFFQRLTNATAVRGLKGQTEDADFDCKEWFPQESAKAAIAKCACGFANATGGVIVIGMSAKRGADGIDVVQEEKPVANVDAVRSAALDAIANLVEPGIEGIQAKVVRASPRSKEGFVLIYIPESQVTPHRSKATKEFYVRIGPQTLPMPYFQIADRFGRRPHARLVVDVRYEIRGAAFEFGRLERILTVTLTNEGRGLARFPVIRFRKLPGVVIANFPAPQAIWAVNHANSEWSSIRGGANDVVYPGESLEVAKLTQRGSPLDQSTWQFQAVTITTETACDGMAAHQQLFAIDAITQ